MGNIPTLTFQRLVILLDSTKRDFDENWGGKGMEVEPKFMWSRTLTFVFII